MDLLADDDIKLIAARMYELSGVSLSPSKRELITGRIRPLLSSYKISTVQKLIDETKSSADVRQNFIDSLTTNLSYFFREPIHFSYLITHIGGLPKRQTNFKILSAGCSFGQECVSIASELLKSNFSNFEITGIDIDSTAIASARTGLYDLKPEEAKPLLDRGHLTQLSPNKFQTSTDLSRKITYQNLSFFPRVLLNTNFDFIFCRNALIYFSKPDQEVIITSLVERMVQSGLLFLGHSETTLNSKLEILKPTIFKKI